MASDGTYVQQPSLPTSHIRACKKLKFIVLGGAGAGKTSIVRRYFHGHFDFHHIPTVGSDFYTKRISDPSTQSSSSSSSRDENIENEKNSYNGRNDNNLLNDEKKDDSPQAIRSVQHVHQPHAHLQDRYLSMQVWDTPGKERYAADRKPIYTAAFSDNFFKNADAAILVYDITSSTSFTHVLKWHADLMERIRRLEATGERTRPFPVLIVANKTDILKQRHTQQRRQQAVVPQRDVMGLAGKNFRGKDFSYEYSASAPSTASKQNLASAAPSSLASCKNTALVSSSSSSSSAARSPRNRFEISTYMGTGDQTSYLEAVLSGEIRGAYLDSLLSTEDRSHPDTDMVLLWCMRNGLKHMQVSALDGK